MFLAFLEKLDNNSKHNVIIIFVFLIILFFYLSLLHLNITHSLSVSDYYRNILTMEVSWHAQHILYEPIGFLWSEYAKLLFPEVHPYKLLSAMNSFFGAGCISLISAILLKRLNFSISKTFITCLVISGSFYFLNYATTIDIYLSALFFMLATFYYATKKAYLTYFDAMIIGILHGTAVGFHQIHILLGIVLLPRILKAGYDKFLIYFLYGIIIVSFVYAVACYAENIHTLQDFIKYFMGSTEQEIIPINNAQSFSYLFGLGMALLGGHYIMAITSFRFWIQEYLPTVLLDKLSYLHHKTGIISGSFQIGLYVVFIVCFSLVIYRFLKKVTLKDLKFQYEYHLIILLYSLLSLLFIQSNIGLLGVPLTFMIIVIFSKIHNTRLLGLTALTILMINILGSALPLLDNENNLCPNSLQSLFEVTD